MGISTQDKLILSESSYDVDQSMNIRSDLRPTKGQLLSADTSKKFYVVDTEDDKNTGFQAMAVAPIVDGQPDMSHIYISYAGTNFDDINDVVTDANNIS